MKPIKTKHTNAVYGKNQEDFENKDINSSHAQPVLAGRASLANNCTREEALLHFGFTFVGRKSIRGNRYSKCYYHEKLQIFAVPFAWRTTYHKFVSRDKVTQKLINKYTSEM